MNQKLSTICEQLNEITQWPGQKHSFPRHRPKLPGKERLLSSSTLSRHFVLIFRRQGRKEEERRGQDHLKSSIL